MTSWCVSVKESSDAGGALRFKWHILFVDSLCVCAYFQNTPSHFMEVACVAEGISRVFTTSSRKRTVRQRASRRRACQNLISEGGCAIVLQTSKFM